MVECCRCGPVNKNNKAFGCYKQKCVYLHKGWGSEIQSQRSLLRCILISGGNTCAQSCPLVIQSLRTDSKTRLGRVRRLGAGGSSQGYCLYNSSQDMNQLPANSWLLPGPMGRCSQYVQGSVFQSRDHRMVNCSCSDMEFCFAWHYCIRRQD